MSGSSLNAVSPDIPTVLAECGDQDSWRETRMLPSAHVRSFLAAGVQGLSREVVHKFIYYYGRF